MKLEPVQKLDIKALMKSAPGRGRRSVYRPLVQAFIASGNPLSKMELEAEETKTLMEIRRLYNSTRAYVRSRGLPILVIRKETEIYLIRLHQDVKGNPLEDHPITEVPPEGASTKQYVQETE